MIDWLVERQLKGLQAAWLGEPGSEQRWVAVEVETELILERFGQILSQGYEYADSPHDIGKWQWRARLKVSGKLRGQVRWASSIGAA